MFQRYMGKIGGYMYTIIYFTGKIGKYKIIYLTEKNRKFHTYNIATELNSYKAKILKNNEKHVCILISP